MNIAILIPALCGGGAERVAQRIGNYYVRQGYKVYYFLADINIKQDYPVKGKIVKTCIKSCMCDGLSNTQILVRLLQSSLEMRKLKAKYNIDVAISFMEEFNYLNILSKGKEKVITRVCTILSEREDLKGILYKSNIIRLFYSMSDRVIVMSRYAVKDMHCHYGIPAKKLFMIPNFVTDLNSGENVASGAYGTKAIVCIGRLEPVKQQDRIIRAFSYVCRIEKGAKLIILGKGPQLRYLKKISENLKIQDNVIFAGFTDNIQKYMTNVRAFVMASKVEGFPNSMIEAMGYGVPVITTASPGACCEIVGKSQNMGIIDSITFCKYGILTPDIPFRKLNLDSPLTEQEVILGNAMMKVITEDEVYEKYKKQSLKRAEMYSLHRVIKKWNCIINNDD